MSELVIRLAMRSGERREIRGTEADIIQWFRGDREDRLIDYVEALDVPAGQWAVYAHTDDTRFDSFGQESNA